MEQGSAEWYAAKCGKVSASRINDVIAKGIGKAPSVSRANYMTELLCERLTGINAENFVSEPMLWGKKHEAAAREAYAFIEGNAVERAGFVDHPTIAMAGASPDGLVEGGGLLEIKCPNTATHLDTIRTGEVPHKYIAQIHWQAACTRLTWCDFVSFDPRLTPELSYFRRRVTIDPAYVIELELAVINFMVELKTQLHALRDYVAKRRAA
jgi:putative phage-type endonuclease